MIGITGTSVQPALAAWPLVMVPMFGAIWVIAVMIWLLQKWTEDLNPRYGPNRLPQLAVMCGVVKSTLGNDLDALIEKHGDLRAVGAATN